MIFRAASVAAVIVCTTGQIAFADQQSYPNGTENFDASQIGHLFEAACIGSVPTLMERRAKSVADLFGFVAQDLGTDAGWISASGAITLTVDGNALAASCEMAMPTDAAGDGDALRDSLTAHIAKATDGAAADPVQSDDGYRWQWDQTNVAYTVDLFLGEGVAITATGEAK